MTRHDGQHRARGRRRAAAERPYDPAPGQRDPHLWGYLDTRFEFVDARTVRLTGDRYPLAGMPLPHFMPFVEELLGVPVGPDHLQEPVPPPALPAPVRHEAFLADLRDALPEDRLDDGEEARLVHSHGQLSVEEIYRLLGGNIPERIVDLVVHPRDEDEVQTLVRLAHEHGVVLIPYGGGTNVSGALTCPPHETRMIVSVDMRRMDRILEIDRANGWAVVEAGITGKELETRLEAEGLTTGHVPDSIELSTLGGWIATHASGMKRNRYGNIEEVVLDAVLVTPRGVVRAVPVVPRSATGIQPQRLAFGSEGGLGIVTRAVLQVWPLPPVRRYASFVFPDFQAGVRYLRAVQAAGVRPASIRLTNNTEFRLGQALGPARHGTSAWVSKAKRWYVTRVKGFDPQRMVACTVVMEGTAAEVRQQTRGLFGLLKDHGGLSGGAENGRRGYAVTFAIAYIRDFLNKLGILGETFETSAPWSRIHDITSSVQAELHRLCAERGVPGRPYLSYRVSQSYRTGVCIYFTMGFCARGLNEPEATFQEIEHRLREVVLEQGGSLSHHHGVGKVRQDFVPRVHSGASIRAAQGLKRSLDPNDVFGAANHLFGAHLAETDAVAPQREEGRAEGTP
ncbi:MAG: FAD-binding oxidoreductase [Trueperaceae bacterium]|nr:FAD-binding oxidoreductase [Trueperaceae bacterium]